MFPPLRTLSEITLLHVCHHATIINNTKPRIGCPVNTRANAIIQPKNAVSDITVLPVGENIILQEW
jgi:hypothetical protein